jgi:YVTN family beta-propeller protein
MRSVFAVLALCLLAILPLAAPGPQWPGPRPEGFLLFNGWRLAPEGIQVPLPDTLPMTLRLDPSGKYLLVLSAGYTQPSVLILDPSNPGREGGVVRVGLNNAWLGLAVHPSGDRFYVPEANAGTVREFALSETQPPAPPAAEGAAPRPQPAVLGVRQEREFKLFEGVANPTARGAARWVRTNFLGDAAVNPAGDRLYVADMQANLIYEVDLRKGTVTRQIRVGTHPYRVLVPGDGAHIYVSNWADGTISVIEAASGQVRATWQTGAHPSDMLADSHDRLLVACANTNAVYVHDIGDGAVRERISVAMHPKSPPGSTPNALALSPDGTRLYVANADNNAVAVVTLAPVGSRVDGFIPTGWYPTALCLSADGRRLFVANGKGLRSMPNPLGPQPTVPSTSTTEYVGRIQKGALSIISVPEEAQLKILTTRTLANSPYADELLEKASVSGKVVPARPGGGSPIRYVMYIIKENRTYDQVLGDMKEGNGDPRLVLFGEKITPNHHKLAREFVLFDNFYVDADVSADGHNWSVGALANDYVQKVWPTQYGGRRPQYDFEGQDPITRSPGGYLWDAALKANITYRSYGEWVNNGPLPTDPGKARVKELEGHIDPLYRSFDTEYLDQKRVDEWAREFREFEKNGNLPRLVILRLPNDHTAGTRAGGLTPRAMVADNDLALGRVIEAVSRSRYWSEMAVFVLEDDAQNGPDHVDSHRSPVFVISPWAKRGSVDSTMYSTVSVLRTIELILGLQPMTQYDAAATPMWTAFADKPDLRPYTLVKPEVDLNERNAPTAPGAAQSARMDFSDVDRIDDDEMNQILWRAMKGNEPMPAPVRSAFPQLASRRK